MKLFLAASLAIFTSLAQAQVLEVNIWQPKMGGLTDAIAAAKEAEGIINKAGGSASVGLDLDGSVHFVTYHDNWAAWAAQTTKLAADEEWNGFVARWNEDPAAMLAENYLLDTPLAGGGGDVYQVFIYEAMPGRSADMFQAVVKAKALLEEDGADVTVHTDQMGRMHFVMNFDTWEDWAKFQDAEHPAFDAFMEERMKDPGAKLVEVYTAANQ